jgi:hypothetical protein
MRCPPHVDERLLDEFLSKTTVAELAQSQTEDPRCEAVIQLAHCEITIAVSDPKQQ